MSLCIALFLTSYMFSQSQIYYFKDSSGQLPYEVVKLKEFEPLDHEILERHSDDIHWYKIPASQASETYMARIEYDRLKNVKAFKDDQEIPKLPKERFITYKFNRDSDVYIRVDPSLHSYIPLVLSTEADSLLRDRNQLLLNGFYYGFVVLMIIYSLFYFFLFKDDAFFYYSMLLVSVSFGLFIMDGMLNFLELSDFMNDFLNMVNYIILAVFSCKFANSYLFLDTHFPYHKKLSYSLCIATVIAVVLFLIFESYYMILLVNIFVFIILCSYWIYGVLLFRKNLYIKIFVLAESIILFSAIDFFILKFMGICLVHIDAMSIKIGAFLEMILLSIAVLYRMRALKAEYSQMRMAIIQFSKKLEFQEQAENKLASLSNREREIFSLIVQVKTNKEIADELNVSINTVKFHIKNIYEKLEIMSRKEAYNIAEKYSNQEGNLISTP